MNAGVDRRLGTRILEAAIDLGVTHFDTAPSYGFGRSEELLGRVLGDDSRFSIATKAGIGAGPRGSALAWARKILKPVAQKMPSASRAMLSAVARQAPPRVQLNVETLRSCFDASRRALKRDHIDFYLLHEPTRDTIGNPQILAYLDSLKGDGGIGAYGMGWGGDVEFDGPRGDVEQLRWSLGHAQRQSVRRDRIYHGILRNYLPLPEALADQFEHLETLSKALDIDIDDRSQHAKLVLSAGLILAKNSMFIISTNDPARLGNSLKGLRWERLDAPETQDVVAAAALFQSIEAVQQAQLPR